MQSIAVIGVGLIGGSFALAQRRAQPTIRVIGIDRDAASLDAALRCGAIDEKGNFASVARCDLVLLAVPGRQIEAVLYNMAPYLHDETLLTDTGSTKGDVEAVARRVLGWRVTQFVPAHPIAGREQSGIAAASADLFDGKNVVLTPHADNKAAVVARSREVWQRCGARVIEMPADRHDAVFAAVSHLPHLLAFALVDALAKRADARTLFSFAASGFRDFTRIASSSPEMWRDIALNNRDALVAELDAYLEHVQQLRNEVAAGNGERIEALMVDAREARNRWLAGDLDHFDSAAS